MQLIFLEVFELKYNFDKVINRKNTGSLKWDFYNRFFESEDLLPLWVADMDFQVPPEVQEAVTEKARFGIYGYTECDQAYYDAIIYWMKKRHNWDIKKEWIYNTPGIVPALNWLVKTFTEPGDGIVVQPPVYYPFFHAIENNECCVVYNQLKLENGSYSIDFVDLEKKLSTGVKLFFLCNPHNPGGIIFSREDLLKIGELCLEKDVLVISDEIHADLMLYDNQHFPISSLSKEFARNTITCNAPSKTFNMAGLQISNAIIPDSFLAEKFAATLAKNAMSRPNIFAITALEAAYMHGAEWLDELISYVEDNHRLVESFMEAKVPQIKVIKAQATYLAWLDCRALGMDNDQLKMFCETKAGLALNQGYIFGPGGEGFMRMNLGCPRDIVKEGLDRLEKAVNCL